MKLAELLSEEKIIIKEQAVEIPNLTTLSLGNVDYKWNGTTWVNATDGKSAPSRVVSKLTSNFKLLNPGKAVFDPARTTAVQVGDRFIVNLKDQTFSFKKSKDADKFLRALRSGKSIPSTIKSFGNNVKEVSRGMWGKFNIGSAMTPAQIDDAVKNSKFLQRTFASNLFNGFFKLLGILGVEYWLFQSFIVNYDQVRATPVEEFEGGEAEKQELLDIITGLFVAQAVAALLMVFRVVRAATLINLIRAPIRTIQLGAAATGAGTIPSLISMIVTEAAFWGAIYLLTRPAVQMAMAQYLVGTVAGSIFEFVGNTADVAAMTLDTITNGAFGGATLRDALTFEGGVKKMPAGTAYASSEWAKLAFQDMIFPPDMEKIKVPYLIVGDRPEAIFNALDIDPSERPAEDLNPKLMSSGQLGQLSDYVFPYTPEMADRLKATHEIVAVSDRMGARPGGSNQELYLAPTKEALASGMPIPMPDNRVLTRTGAKIERDSDQDTTQDPIVDIANNAINQADSGIGTSTGRSNAPVQPVGRVSSSRPRGVQGSVRPGDETNALDALAADSAR